ncbi:putative reverse transcriptase domain-containing protein [Tanacetum coccineum]
MEEINNFQQEPNETLYQAWQRFKELLMRCPQHYLTDIQEWHNGTSTRTRSTETSDGLAAIQAQLNNLGKEIKKVNEKVYVAQEGCELRKGSHYTKDCLLKEEEKTLEETYYTQFGVPFQQGGQYRAAALGFYQRNNANPSYQERRQSMKESLIKFMTESAKRHEENSNLIKEIRASTDVDSMLFSVPNQMTIPFPSRLYHCDKEKGSYRLKDIDAYSIGTTLRNDALPQKEKYLGSFTLPCYINNICFEKSLADLGASVSVMPFSTYINLGLGELAHTKLTVELADRTVKHPKGIIENILVGIGKFVFPVDFIILDMPEDVKVPLILGRPFLSTAHTKIDVFKRKITLRVNGKTSIFNRSLDPLNGYYIELNDLNEPLELMRNQDDYLEPTIDEGEVDIDKVRCNDEIIGGLDEYPSFCDLDRKIHIECAYNLKFSCMIGYEHVDANFFPLLSINVMSKSFYNLIMKDKMEFKGKNIVGTFINMPIFVGNFSVMTNFAVVEDMDNYRDDGMGDVIVGKPFCREFCVKTKRFEGMINIFNGNDSVTYQMARSHPRFKHLTNEKRNKIPPLLKVSEQDKMNGISHSYQKLKVFTKGSWTLDPNLFEMRRLWKGSHTGTLACIRWNEEPEEKSNLKTSL